MITRGSADDSNLLPYIMNTIPDPLQVSTAHEVKFGQLQIEVGTRLAAPNTYGDGGDGGGKLPPPSRGGGSVWCQEIQVCFYVGEGADHLTASADKDGLVASIAPNDDGNWNTRVDIKDGVISCKFQATDPVRFTGANSFVVVINKIPINRAVGDAIVRIVERTSETNSHYQPRSATRRAPKATSEFYFHNLHPLQPAVDLGTAPTLTWEGNSANSTFTIRWYDETKQEMVSDQANGITWTIQAGWNIPRSTTTYLVIAEHTPDGHSTPLRRTLSTTVQVKKPDVIANKITTTDLATLNTITTKDLNASNQITSNNLNTVNKITTKDLNTATATVTPKAKDGPSLWVDGWIEARDGICGRFRGNSGALVVHGQGVEIHGGIDAGRDRGNITFRRNVTAQKELIVGETFLAKSTSTTTGNHTVYGDIRAKNGTVTGNLNVHGYHEVHGDLWPQDGIKKTGAPVRIKHHYGLRVDGSRINDHTVVHSGSQVRLYNTYQGEYLYAASYAPFDSDRRRVFTWRPGGAVSQGGWEICHVTNPTSRQVDQDSPAIDEPIPQNDNVLPSVHLDLQDQVTKLVKGESVRIGQRQPVPNLYVLATDADGRPVGQVLLELIVTDAAASATFGGGRKHTWVITDATTGTVAQLPPLTAGTTPGTFMLTARVLAGRAEPVSWTIHVD